MVSSPSPLLLAKRALDCIAIPEIEEAMELARSALMLAPNDAFVHSVIGQVFMQRGLFSEAAFHFDQSLHLNTAKAQTFNGLIKSLVQAGQASTALAIIEKNKNSLPNDARTFSLIASALRTTGKTEEAAEFSERAYQLDPQAPVVILEYAIGLKKSGRETEAIAILGNECAKQSDPRLLFECARLLDEKGEYELAFRRMSAANAVASEELKLSYQRDLAEKLTSETLSFFTQERMQQLPVASVREDLAQPIFVCGFPRSGTTLAESLLSTSPMIDGFGELPFMPALRSSTSGMLSTSLSYPFSLLELLAGDKTYSVNTLRDEYINRVSSVRRLPKNGFFIDKLPLNEFNIGLIKMLFPESPCIIMERSRNDVILSAFSVYLTHGFNCGFDLFNIKNHLSKSAKVTQHFANSVAGVARVKYEELVTNTDAVLRKVFDEIPVEFPVWQDFYKQNSEAITPNSDAIARPIFESSVGRSNNYREFVPDKLFE